MRFTKALKNKVARGFTAIEVMLSLTVLAIGTAGVIAMQTTAIDGNYDARRLDVANGVLREWTERLRRDSMMWTLPNTRNPLVAGDNRVAAAPLLTVVAPNPAAAAWHVPIEREADTIPLFPQADLLGRDITGAGVPVMFCTQVALSWLDQPNGLILANIRVFWPRGTGAMGSSDCGPDDPAAGWAQLPATIDKYHFVYGVTAIRKNPSP